jgi:hypothetical protein
VGSAGCQGGRGDAAASALSHAQKRCTFSSFAWAGGTTNQ